MLIYAAQIYDTVMGHSIGGNPYIYGGFSSVVTHGITSGPSPHGHLTGAGAVRDWTQGIPHDLEEELI